MTVCADCGVAKPAAAFNVDRSRKNGLRFVCRECDRARHHARYWREREQQKLRHGPRRSRAEKVALHPERERARDRLRTAVYQGRVAKPLACQACSEPTPKQCLAAHHADYSRPFDVEWLCTRCHGLRHRRSA